MQLQRARLKISTRGFPELEMSYSSVNVQALNAYKSFLQEALKKKTWGGKERG
jgi:hypothetical protein